MSIIAKIKSVYDLQSAKRKWRLANGHNLTRIINNFNQKCVTVGSNTYGSLYVLTFNPKYRLEIGCNCSLANDVKFLLGCDHELSNISTYPYKVQLLHSVEYEATSNGNIRVDDDVWIGENAIVLSGVHIGQGAVIAAGAVVTNDVPPYTVVGGVPAKVIKYRFTKPVIDVLMTIDYSMLTKEMIHEHIDDLYDPLEGLSVEDVQKKIAWLLKKQI